MMSHKTMQNLIGVDKNYWLIEVHLDVMSAKVEFVFTSNPDSNAQELLVAFQKINSISITYFDSNNHDDSYAPFLLGLISELTGKTILTTDAFELSFLSDAPPVMSRMK